MANTESGRESTYGVSLNIIPDISEQCTFFKTHWLFIIVFKKKKKKKVKMYYVVSPEIILKKQ